METNKINTFVQLSLKDKHQYIYDIFKKSNSSDALTILEYILSIPYDDKPVHALFVNLLCVTLAKTHSSDYLEYIVKAKRYGDCFCYVDSNLLFEFYNSIDEKDPIGNTINKWKDYIINETTPDWIIKYIDLTTYYSNNYENDLIFKQREKYESLEFHNYCLDIFKFY